MPLKVGDFVHLDGSESSAEILAIKGNEAEISIGHLKSFVKISRLQKATKKSQAAASQSSYNSQNLDLVEKRISMGYQIDIRGMRAEEVMTKMDNVMDQALLVGQNELRIVHGKGNGVLRKVVREHLRSYNEVQTMEDEHADRGGDGVTIVRLR